MFTLTQVYGGVRIGAHCPNCKAGDAKCIKNYVWLTNYVQNLRVVAQLLAGVSVGVALRRCSSQNRRAWLQSQRIMRQFVGQLWGAARYGRAVYGTRLTIPSPNARFTENERIYIEHVFYI